MKYSKKFLSLILIIFVFIGSIPLSGLSAFADDTLTTGSCGENVTYSFDSSTGTLTISGSGSMADYKASDLLNNYSPFYNNGKINSVVIGEGITKIGNCAFLNCVNLNSISFANSITEIGNSTFEGCTGLTSLTIPGTIKTIGAWAFEDCSNLKNLTISKGVESLDFLSFRNTGITSIEIPDTVTRIREGTFAKCNNLQQIVVDENNPVFDSRNNCNAIIKTETNGFVAGCKKSAIPNDITEICLYAFYGINDLKFISIPQGVKKISNSAFENCLGLTGIKLPQSVEKIAYHAFYNATDLSFISVLNNNCDIYSRTETFPTSATIYGFEGSTAQTYAETFDRSFILACDGTNHQIIEAVISEPSWQTNGKTLHCCKSCSYSQEEITYLSGSCGESATYSFDADTGALNISGFGSMYAGAFRRRTAIKSLIINNGITAITEQAFAFCSNLKSIVISDSVESISDSAFLGSDAVESIEISSQNQAFYSANNCNAIIDSSTTTLLFGCKNTVIPNTVTKIGGYAFYRCDGLTNISIPQSVTSIDNYAFAYCNVLESIELPNSIVSIGQMAFYSSRVLNSVNIPSSVTSIGAAAFTYTGIYNDSNNWQNDLLYLDNWLIKGNDISGVVSVSDGTVGIADNAFSGCTNITTVTIPNTVTKIGSQTFYGCTSLTDITLPNSITTIGNGAFYNCSALTNISIPNSVTQIDSSAFSNCSGLKSIILLNNSCAIYDSTSVFPASAEIIAHNRSTAKTYADKYSRKFTSLCDDCYEETERVEATNTKSGYSIKTCSVCGNQEKEELICYRTHADSTRFADQQFVLPVAKSCVYNNTLYARFDKQIYGYNCFGSKFLYAEMLNKGIIENTKELVKDGPKSWYIVGGKLKSDGWYHIFQDTKIPDDLLTWSPNEPNGGTSEPMLSITTADGGFNDISYESKSPGFIVAIGLDQLQPTKESTFSTNKYAYYEMNYPFSYAQTFCEAKGGYLASISSKAENDSIMALISNKERVYFGGIRNAQGNFEWVNGEDFSYTNWYPGEPNNGAGAGQYFMQSYTNGQWDDCNDLYAENKSNQVGFVCEYEPKSLSVSIDQDETHRVTNNEIHILANYPDGTTSDITDACEITHTYINGNIEVAATAVKPNGESINVTEQIPVEGEHTYTQVVVKESNCIEEGSIANICTVCKNRFDEVVPALGHNYQATKTVLPTCTTEGYTKLTCSVCGDRTTGNVVAAKGHSVDSGTVLQTPDCENAGSKIFKCSECDYFYTEEIPAIGHNYSSVTVSPTCSKDGYDTYTCENCGDSYTANIVPATGHTYQTSVKEATCTQGGFTTYTCSNCGSSYKADIVNPLGHDFSDFVLNQDSGEFFDGTRTSTCSRCGVSKTGNVNPTTLYARSIAASSGKQITIPVIIKNNTGLMGFGFEFSYDASILTPVKVECGDIISDSLYFDDNLEGDAEPGKFKVIWGGEDELTTNGCLINLVFNVADNVETKTTINIACVQDDTFDENFKDVAVNCESINVNISKSFIANSYFSSVNVFDESNNKTTDTLIIGDDEKIFICVDDTIHTEQNFSVKNKITFDTSAFTFEGYADKDRNDILTSNVESTGTINIIHNGTGVFNELTPEEVFESMGVKYLVFSVNETVSKGEYSFVSELITENEFDVIESLGCSVILEESRVQGANVYTEPVAETYYDETISVPVKISGNPGIMGYQIEFEYNPEQLQPISAIKGSSFKGYFVDSIGVESGKFIVLWYYQENNYSNGDLFTLTFRVITDESVLSPVAVTYSQDDTFNEEYDDVILSCNNFTIPLNCSNHQFVVKSQTAPTCEESGTVVYSCENCGYEYSEFIEPLGHLYTKRVVSAATHRVDNTYFYSCERCSKVDRTYSHYFTDSSLVNVSLELAALNGKNAQMIIVRNGEQITANSTSGVFEFSAVETGQYGVYVNYEKGVTTKVQYVNIGLDNNEKTILLNNKHLPTGNVNGDEVIDIADIAVLLQANIYGTRNETNDLNGDNIVDIADISVVLSALNYGMSSVTIQ